jgi:YegS/Rv2252/BmrU family lipid kinase
MRERIENARSAGFDAVVLIGGDGTVHEALPAVTAEGLPLGIIPCGRGNDFARNLGLPLDPRANLFLDGVPERRRVDLPSVNGVPFGSIACIGFDAEVNRLARDGRGYFRGTLGYLVCVLRALPGFRPFDVQVRIGDRFWSGEILMMAVANGACYGRGMKIAPAAIMEDGRLDVCIVEPLPKLELLWNFPQVFRGTHITHPKVTMDSGSSVVVSSTEPHEIFADGEYVGTTPAVCAISRQSLELLLPTGRQSG